MVNESVSDVALPVDPLSDADLFDVDSLLPGADTSLLIMTCISVTSHSLRDNMAIRVEQDLRGVECK